MKLLQDGLQDLLNCRSKYFGVQAALDVFARDDKNMLKMAGEVETLCQEPAEFWRTMCERISLMYEKIRLLGFAHASLALAYEMEYVLQAVVALREYAKSTLQTRDGRSALTDDPRSGTRSDDAFNLVSSPHFQAAFRAKMKQLKLLNRCLGMWHPRSEMAMQELKSMAAMDKSDGLPQRLLALLKELNVMGKAELRDNEVLEIGLDVLAEVTTELKKPGKDVS